MKISYNSHFIFFAQFFDSLEKRSQIEKNDLFKELNRKKHLIYKDTAILEKTFELLSLSKK